jgi:hypothetical protein
MHAKIRTAVGVALVALAVSATAGNKSWSGDDLYAAKQISFPTTEPTLDETSLLFGPGTEPNGKLIQYTIKNVNPKHDTLIRIRATLIRLSADWDPYIVVSDGARWIGVAIFDPSAASSPTGGMARMEGADLADRGLPDYYTGAIIVVAAGGFPGVGETVDVTLEFLLSDASTTVAGAMLGGAGSFVAPPLNRSSSLSVVLMRDNEPTESYGVETLAIETRVAK